MTRGSDNTFTSVHLRRCMIHRPHIIVRPHSRFRGIATRGCRYHSGTQWMIEIENIPSVCLEAAIASQEGEPRTHTGTPSSLHALHTALQQQHQTNKHDLTRRRSHSSTTTTSTHDHLHTTPPPPHHTPMADNEAQTAALQEKEAGNVAYKSRDFATAITHYQKAWELHKDITFLNNLAGELGSLHLISRTRPPGGLDLVCAAAAGLRRAHRTTLPLPLPHAHHPSVISNPPPPSSFTAQPPSSNQVTMTPS